MRGGILRIAAVAAAIAGLTNQSHAAFVFGIQPSSSLIVRVDSTTGAIASSFSAPVPLTDSNTALGLSMAENDSVLLFINGFAPTTLYRLDPTNGAILSTVAVNNWTTTGLSYANIGGVDTVFRHHGTGNGDVHEIAGYGSSDSFSFTPGNASFGLGGDGHGRQFGIFSDGIHEFSETTGAILNTFAAPVNARGVAFDGTNLYVSTTFRTLLTLNPNTGAVLQSVSVAGGTLYELGAPLPSDPAVATPLPPTLLAGFLGMTLLAGVRRFRRA